MRHTRMCPAGVLPLCNCSRSSDCCQRLHAGSLPSNGGIQDLHCLKQWAPSFLMLRSSISCAFQYSGENTSRRFSEGSIVRHTRMCPAGVLPLCKSSLLGNCSSTPAQAVNALTNVSILTTGVSLHRVCEQRTYPGMIQQQSAVRAETFNSFDRCTGHMYPPLKATGMHGSCCLGSSDPRAAVGSCTGAATRVHCSCAGRGVSCLSWLSRLVWFKPLLWAPWGLQQRHWSHPWQLR